MPRRIGRPGLLGTMARTAVITGTAQAVSGNVARRQQRRWHDQAQEQAQAQVPAPATAPPSSAAAPPESPGGDLMAQLAQLGQMRQAGLLSDAEFSAAKAKLLG